MKILLDAMGGDNAPEATIKGAVESLKLIDKDTEIILVGKPEVINQKIKEYYKKEDIKEVSPRLSIIPATEQIEMIDKPTDAIKHKKDSSMVVGFNKLKEDVGECFISAGNSGALLAGATLIIGRIKGIERPALAGILPSYNSKLLLMDCGANTNVKPSTLVQFAQMATIYLKSTFGYKNPTCGLLNIGTEPTKVNELIREAYNLLSEKADELDINFVGNVEGRDAFTGDLDILVCDGFTGNVFLKTVEGFGKLVKSTLSDSLKKNIFTKIGALGALPSINNFKQMMNYKEYGGALFLGVSKPVIKAHGSADAFTFSKTIVQAEQFVKNKAVERMKKEFEKTNK